MLKSGVIPVQPFQHAIWGMRLRYGGDAPPVVLTKDDDERTVHLAEVKRLHFDKWPLALECGKEQCAVAGIVTSPPKSPATFRGEAGI